MVGFIDIKGYLLKKRFGLPIKRVNAKHHRNVTVITKARDQAQAVMINHSCDPSCADHAKIKIEPLHSATANRDAINTAVFIVEIKIPFGCATGIANIPGNIAGKYFVFPGFKAASAEVRIAAL